MRHPGLRAGGLPRMTAAEHESRSAGSTPIRLHVDELSIDAALVRCLLAEQFPPWEDLPLAMVPSGTDNVTFRLGQDMAIRMPRTASAAASLAKEMRWLPRLAPRLPVPTPVPLAEGAPGSGYPLPWAVVRWLAGEDAARASAARRDFLAGRIAAFVVAMREIDAAGGPVPGAHNSWRGVPLAERARETEAAIAALKGIIDTGLATESWTAALAAPPGDGRPAWIHGDLHAANLLMKNGRLSGVIDFGCLGVGDPACDLMAAWTVLSSRGRAVFREAVQVSDAAWARGRGWALSMALIALPYYRGRDRVMTEMASHVMAEVFAEHRQGSWRANAEGTRA